MIPATRSQDRVLETIEADAWAQLYTHADAGVERQLSLATHRIAGAVAVVAAAVDILAHNRVVGLGLDGPVDDGTIATLVATYRAHSVRRFIVQVSPHADVELPARLRAHGFSHHNDWVKLVRDVEPNVDARSDLSVERIDRQRAGEFGHVFATSFGWPRRVAPWIGSLVGAPGWSHYLATEGGRGVATGATYTDGAVGWIDFASTLPAYRGRGAQSALVARRIADAAAAGVRTLVVETGVATGSFRNLTRMGFSEQYRRANYILVLD